MYVYHRKETSKTRKKIVIYNKEKYNNFYKL